MSRAETKKTVIIAGLANLIIAITKIIAGLLAGSSAMLAEGAHSVADTMNQGFLLTSLQKSARPADKRHPFGYGNERYFWSLLAAVGIFVAGAGFSVFEGVLAIFGSEGSGKVWLAYAVLGVSFVLEGVSWIRAFTQGRKEAKGELIDHVKRSPDITFKAALFEDTAAVIGLVLAAIGLTLKEITGSGMWDGIASILIGILLVTVAYVLGRDSRSLLIGQAADPAVQKEIRELISSTDDVDDLVELFTMHLGPDEIIVAANVNFADGISAGDAERCSSEIAHRLQKRLPIVRNVFLDPSQRRRRVSEVS